MRQILFRGKRNKQEDPLERWIEGSYIKYTDIRDKKVIRIASSCGYMNDVIPETIGQFTGLIAEKCKSNLDKRIFEHDIFRHTKETDEGDIVGYSVVMWLKKYAAYYLIPVEHYIILNNDIAGEEDFSWLFDEALLRDFSIDVGLTKVGNIFDNPELLI